ncbi:MAG: DUF1385 domain-containing protein [Candidatus Bathyarchaeota archaeon]|nr:DUF1385 domain-containing protein [Candidatus Bathyarchaeota archaeon]MDH5595088.1 DUF1385 domain-containing protein [Candidatus Bathyarchaeota archaeon]
MKSGTQGREESSLAFGGQALIEGVMMRSRTHVVMCVRDPNNKILTNIEKINSLSERHKILGLPFLRGIIGLLETFYLGVKGVYFSANAVLEEEEEKFTYKELTIVFAMALVLASFFFIVPFLLTNLFGLKGVLFNIVEAIVRLAMFLLYLSLVAMWGEFKRILQYHGAEHKTINAYEARVALKVVNVKRFSRLHPRCGTSFIFIVLLVSILLFSIMPDLGFFARLAYRVLLIPVIGAVSYELLKLSGRYKDSIITRILTMPGLAFQRLTTREPDDDMMEVAIKAVEEVSRLSGS